MPEKDIKLHELVFTVEKSIRYNGRREEFYAQASTVLTGTSILFGSAAFLDFFFKYVGHQEILILIATLISVAGIILKFPEKMSKHATLKRLFTDLLSAIKSSKSPKVQQVREWDVRRINLDLEEPVTYCALEAFCDNEVNIAYGWHRHQGLVPLTWWQRHMMNVRKFDKVEFPDRVRSTCLASEVSSASPAVEEG